MAQILPKAGGGAREGRFENRATPARARRRSAAETFLAIAARSGTSSANSGSCMYVGTVVSSHLAALEPTSMVGGQSFSWSAEQGLYFWWSLSGGWSSTLLTLPD